MELGKSLEHRSVAIFSLQIWGICLNCFSTRKSSLKVSSIQVTKIRFWINVVGTAVKIAAAEFENAYYKKALNTRILVSTLELHFVSENIFESDYGMAAPSHSCTTKVKLFFMSLFPPFVRWKEKQLLYFISVAFLWLIDFLDFLRLPQFCPLSRLQQQSDRPCHFVFVWPTTTLSCLGSAMVLPRSPHRTTGAFC